MPKKGTEKGLKMPPCCSSQISITLENVSWLTGGKGIKVYYLWKKKPLSGYRDP